MLSECRWGAESLSCAQQWACGAGERRMALVRLVWREPSHLWSTEGAALAQALKS